MAERSAGLILAAVPKLFGELSQAALAELAKNEQEAATCRKLQWAAYRRSQCSKDLVRVFNALPGVLGIDIAVHGNARNARIARIVDEYCTKAVSPSLQCDLVVG